MIVVVRKLFMLKVCIGDIFVKSGFFIGIGVGLVVIFVIFCVCL